MKTNEHLIGIEKLPAPVYYVTSESDGTVLIGINVVRKGREISWFDTIKERVMRVDTVIDSNPSNYSFRRPDQEGGHSYRFVPMTLEVYESFVKDRLVQTKDFTDEASMIHAFLETTDNIW